MAGFGTFAAAFRALHAVEVVVFAAFGGTLFAGLDTDAGLFFQKILNAIQLAFKKKRFRQIDGIVSKP